MIKLYKYPTVKTNGKEYTDKKILESAKDYLGDGSPCVTRDSYGKPHITVDTPLFVSITHTDDMLLVALSDFDIGIDAERAGRTIKNPAGLAKRYFTREEAVFLGENPTCADFLEMWVKKEALSKLIGKGVPCMKQYSVFSPEFELIEQNIDGYIVYIAKRKES